MKRFLILIISIGLFLLSFQQDDDIKVWKSNSPLQWSDFKGTETPLDANSRSNTVCREAVKYTPILKDSSDLKKDSVDLKKVTADFKFTFSVISQMSRNHSWVDPYSKTPELLQHEQLHFDISEYFARQLQSELDHHLFTKNYKDEIKELKIKCASIRNSMEILYDKQTNNSRNKHMQAKWKDYVEGLLSSNVDLETALKNEPKK